MSTYGPASESLVDTYSKLETAKITGVTHFLKSKLQCLYSSKANSDLDSLKLTDFGFFVKMCSLKSYIYKKNKDN